MDESSEVIPPPPPTQTQTISMEEQQKLFPKVRVKGGLFKLDNVELTSVGENTTMNTSPMEVIQVRE